MTFDVKNKHEIFQFASVGALDSIKELLKKQPHLITIQEYPGMDTPLIIAARYGHLATVQWLLKEGGSNINECDVVGNTALLWAASNGHLEMVQWLLKEGGAKIDQRNKIFYTALLHAARDGHLRMVQWLLKDAGAKVDEKGIHGETALLLAAANGHLETVQWLLKEGQAKVDQGDIFHETALLQAARYGQLVTLQWLLKEAYANIEQRNNNLNTALLQAANYGQLETVRWLLKEAIARIDEKDIVGNTALHLAASNGHLSTVQWLLSEGGAQLNEQNIAGTTAYRSALANHQEEVALYLYHYGKQSKQPVIDKNIESFDLQVIDQIRCYKSICKQTVVQKIPLSLLNIINEYHPSCLLETEKDQILTYMQILHEIDRQQSALIKAGKEWINNTMAPKIPHLPEDAIPTWKDIADLELVSRYFIYYSSKLAGFSTSGLNAFGVFSNSAKITQHLDSTLFYESIREGNLNFCTLL